jgi:hypothetical protein
MSTQILPDPVTVITEFVPKSTGGTWTGTCGETALAVAMGASKGFEVTPSFIDQITQEMVSRGEAQPNGGSWTNTLAAYAKRHGYSIVYENDAPGAGWSGWVDYARQYAGIKPIVLNIHNGQALVDLNTGTRDEPGLQNHVITIVGKQDNGYICADGDNAMSRNRKFVIYDKATIDAAQPQGMLVLDMQRPVTQPAGGTGVLPKGWLDNTSTPGSEFITAPNGVTIVRGFRVWCLSHPDWLFSAGVPLYGEYQVQNVDMDPAHGPGTEQLFVMSALGYTDKENVFVMATGAMIQSCRGQINTLQKQVDTLNAQATENAKCIAAVQTMKAALDTVP